jgi:hypothetical protein
MLELMATSIERIHNRLDGMESQVTRVQGIAATTLTLQQRMEQQGEVQQAEAAVRHAEVERKLRVMEDQAAALTRRLEEARVRATATRPVCSSAAPQGGELALG